MRLTGLETLHLRSTLEAGSPSEAHALFSREVRRDAASPAAEEKPDTRYWLDYDYFMIESEARALRRAYVLSLLGKLAKWVPARVSTWMTGRPLRGA
jgi:hypothetical protein